MTPRDLRSSLKVLQERTIITEPDKNLRSKIDSIVRSIESLSAKRDRIDYEIKRQKKSLERKRMELKKSNTHLRSEQTLDAKFRVSSGLLSESLSLSLGDIDDYLLRESHRVLEK